MKGIFTAVLLLSLTGSAAYGLLQLLSLVGGRRLSQGWRYRGLLLVGALFALPVQKLWALFPRRSLFVRAVRAAVTSGAGVRTGVRALGRSAGAAAAVWLIVACGLIAWDLVRLALCKRTLRKSGRPAAGELRAVAEETAARMKLRARPRLFVSFVAQSPMLTGFFKPVVTLPEGEWSREGLSLILAHEFTHFRRLDLWKKLFFTLLRRVHWFNPVACLMWRDFAYRMETACDERVAVGLDREGRRSYGFLLIDCAPSLRREAAFVSFASNRKKLERRIRLMMRSSKKTRTIFGVVLALVLLAGCFAITALAAENSTVKDLTGKVGYVVIDTTNAKPVETEAGESVVVYVDGETGEKVEAPMYVYDFSDCEIIETEPDTVWQWTPVEDGDDLGTVELTLDSGSVSATIQASGTLTTMGYDAAE